MTVVIKITCSEFNCHDIYFLTMAEWENEGKDAHPSSVAEKEFLLL